MCSVLYKYRDHSDEYLVYDMKKNEEQVDAGKARYFFSQNFGLAASGILAGPFVKNGRVSMMLFTPEGREETPKGTSELFEQAFLQDAGYVCSSAPSDHDISFAGKVFVF